MIVDPHCLYRRQLTRREFSFAICARDLSRPFSMLQCILTCGTFVVFILVSSFAFPSLALQLSLSQPTPCRYNKHVAFHAMQISRLSVPSLENLAICVAKRELPSDFPPKDTAVTLFNYADGSKTVGNPVIITLTPTAVTYTRSHVGDDQPLVTVSNRTKRPLTELEAQLEAGDSSAFVCEFTPTPKVRGRSWHLLTLLHLMPSRCHRSCDC
jgi:hypothetical protein